MRAVVLVGGYGTRLRPLTYTTPKQMLPVGHRPMIEPVVEHLGLHGIDEVVLALGYKADKFVADFPDDRCGGVRMRYAVEPEPLDTAGAVRFAAEEIGIDETFVVINADVLTSLDLTAFVAFHRRAGAEGTIHLITVDDPSAFGVVALDEHRRVERFVEKPKREEAPSHLINAGTYVLEPSVLDRIPLGRKTSIERVVFPAMAADGGLFAVPTNDYWLDAGTPATYLRANLDLLDRGGCDAVGPGATVEAGVLLQHAIVGAGAAVRHGAVLEGSVLLPGACVGAAAVIRNSVIGYGADVGAGAHLDGVVLGDDVAVADGTKLSNVRVPEPEA